jgi:uncharacterized membrane protein HdeD (DUF308 family)
MTLLLVLAVITAMFGLWLSVKNFTKLKICAICLAVSTIWVGLFVAYRIGKVDDPVLLALLMGQSIAGIYYFWEKRASKEWLIFRLPALLTLTYVFYGLITWQTYGPAGLFLAGVWLVFGAVYALRHVPRIKRAARKLIDCCANW